MLGFRQDIYCLNIKTKVSEKVSAFVQYPVNDLEISTNFVSAGAFGDSRYSWST